MKSEFFWATCQVGAEPALKEEVARVLPGSRFAYSRPGFVSFRLPLPVDLHSPWECELVFARSYGLSVDKVVLKPGESAHRAIEILETELKELQAVFLKDGGEPFLRVQLLERDRYAPEDAPKGFVPGEWESLWRLRLPSEIRQLEAETESSLSPVQPGEKVLDLIAVSENELWIGVHLHGPTHFTNLKKLLSFKLPPEAPSRAYLKLQQALEWAGNPILPGQNVVELGSAPGGAVAALLEKGVSVVGVDPGKMDPRVLKPGFKWVVKSAKFLGAADLPRPTHWLLSDMNIDPDSGWEIISQVLSMILPSVFGKQFQGVFWTLKLNRWDLSARIPEWLEELKDVGFRRVSAKQLPGNRQEVTIFASDWSSG